MSITLPDERIARLLEDRAVEISVGGPWDFESSAGQNRLEGRILRVEAGGSEGSGSVRMEVTPFVSRAGRTVDLLDATARYDETPGIVERLALGRKVPANLDYSDQVPPGEMPEGSNPFLIGSVRLA